MNEEQLLQHISKTINNDVQGIVKSFYPLYENWLVECLERYKKEDPQNFHLHLINLMTNSLMNLTNICMGSFISDFPEGLKKEILYNTREAFNRGFENLEKQLGISEL